MNADESSKQPEEQGQLVAAVGETNLVKQTNDDAVSLDKVYCRNGDTSVQAMPEIRLDEGSSPKVIFYFSQQNAMLVPIHSCIKQEAQ